MSESFDALPAPEKELILALPYRVGLWISALETEGGEGADEAEGAALIDALDRIGKSRQYEFPAWVCRKILENDGPWLAWSGDLSAVPQECTRAMDLLFRTLSPVDLEHYREALFLIAAMVACAYREEDNPESGFNGWTDLSARARHLLKTLGGQAVVEDEQNISSRERAALIVLARALGLGPLLEAGTP